MAPRSSWKGFLRLSLVSVPVKAFTANNTGEEIRLNQLHKECNARVKYQKICPEHGVLQQSDIVSGYEFAKDQYVIVDEDELDEGELGEDWDDEEDWDDDEEDDWEDVEDDENDGWGDDEDDLF